MDDLFLDDIHTKSSKVRDVEKIQSIKSVYRDAKGYGQAVVKLRSYAAAGSLNTLVNYINKEDASLEDPNGNEFNETGEVKDILQDWKDDEKQRNYKNKKNRVAAHIILSSPSGSKEQVRRATRDFAFEQFGDNHDYLFAVHNDTAHPHAHIVLKLRGYDGKKIRFDKKDLENLRLAFAESLREQGIKANSSYRSDRGVGVKGVTQSIFQMRKRKVNVKNDRETVKEAIKESATAKGNKRPWEKAQREKNSKTKEKYVNLSNYLINSSDKKMKEIGRVIKKYADGLPKPKTQREIIQQRLRNESEQGRGEIER